MSAHPVLDLLVEAVAMEFSTPSMLPVSSPRATM